MIPPCVSVFLMDVRARWSLYWWLRSRGQVAHMTKVRLSSIMLRRIPLFNWKSVTIPVFKKWKQKKWIRNHKITSQLESRIFMLRSWVVWAWLPSNESVIDYVQFYTSAAKHSISMATIWAIFEKRKIKININLAYYESYARPDDDVWWCMLPKKCLLLIRLKSYLAKVCTKWAEVSFWHGFKHLQSRSRGMSVVRRSWFVYSPRETTRLTNHADDFANVNSHACQKKTSAHPR